MSCAGGQRDSLALPVEGEVVFTSFLTLLFPLDDRRECGTVGKGEALALALSGEHVDAIVCVLASGVVVFFDLVGDSNGPRETRRIEATPPLYVSRLMRNMDPSRATCAAVFPTDVSYMCRVPPAALASARSGDTKRTTGGTVYLRGAVGSSDGRVDVFSEEGYVFGFVASDGPVVAVSPIYSTSFSSGEAVGVKSWEQLKMARVPLPAEGSDEERTLDRATANLGFVTSSATGVVCVWRRDSGGLKPAVLGRSSFLSRTMCWHAVQPSSRDWILSGVEVTRTPFIVHTTPGLKGELCARSAVTFDDVEGRVRLPGNMMSRTTAVASDGDSVLVARGNSVFHVIFANSSCVPVLTADSSVSGLYISGGSLMQGSKRTLVAACDVRGTVYFLSGGTLSTIGHFKVTGGGPVGSLSIHAPSRLVTVVGADGTALVLPVPDSSSSTGETVLQRLAALHGRSKEARKVGEAEESAQ